MEDFFVLPASTGVVTEHDDGSLHVGDAPVCLVAYFWNEGEDAYVARTHTLCGIESTVLSDDESLQVTCEACVLLDPRRPVRRRKARWRQ